MLPQLIDDIIDSPGLLIKTIQIRRRVRAGETLATFFPRFITSSRAIINQHSLEKQEEEKEVVKRAAGLRGEAEILRVTSSGRS